MGRLGIFVALAALAAALGLSGCGGGGNPSSITKPKVRVINAALYDEVSAPRPLRVDLNTDTFENSVAYLATNTTFKEKKAGTYDVQVYDDAAAEPSLWAETGNFQNDKNYVILTFGLENYGTELIKRVRTTIVDVDLTAPVGNTAKLFVFHGFNRGAGFDTPNIDFQNPGDNPQFKLSDIGYGNGQQITVDSGSALTFEVRRAGTEQVYVSSTPTLDAGGVYMVVVSGIEGASGVQAPTITYMKLNN